MNPQTHYTRRQFLILTTSALVTTLALAACAAPPTVVPAAPATSAPVMNGSGAKTFIAKLDGAPASARAVIVVEEGKFDAYVCSFDDAFNLMSARWYKGELDANGNFQATSKDGVEFKGTISGDQFTGALTNTEKKTMPFSGSAVSTNGPAGLYRGIGKFGGRDVIVGAVLSADGTNAATAQYKGAFEFVSPVANQFVNVGSDQLGVKIGDYPEQVVVERVKTLKGDSIF